MKSYEIYYRNNVYQIWQWVNNGVNVTCTLFKTFKTRKAQKTGRASSGTRLSGGNLPSSKLDVLHLILLLAYYYEVW